MTVSVNVDTGVSCELHKSHRPADLTVEFHHVIPVAWQLHTATPAVPPYPGKDQDGRGMLWDDRGVWVCPTGHRNVHYWIVKLMHALADEQTGSIPAAQVATRRGRVSAEFATALLALQRYEPYGSLLALTQEGEWGVA